MKSGNSSAITAMALRYSTRRSWGGDEAGRVVTHSCRRSRRAQISPSDREYAERMP
jgi:hypothetical protein